MRCAQICHRALFQKLQIFEVSEGSWGVLGGLLGVRGGQGVLEGFPLHPLFHPFAPWDALGRSWGLLGRVIGGAVELCGGPRAVHRGSKEGHGSNLKMLKIRLFSLCFRAWGEPWAPLGLPLGGPRRPRGGLEEEKVSLWTSKGAPEELREGPKRYGKTHVHFTV